VVFFVKHVVETVRIKTVLSSVTVVYVPT